MSRYGGIFNGKQGVFLGYFHKEMDAAKAWDSFMRKNYAEFTRFNFSKRE